MRLSLNSFTLGIISVWIKSTKLSNITPASSVVGTNISKASVSISSTPLSKINTFSFDARSPMVLSNVAALSVSRSSALCSASIKLPSICCISFILPPSSNASYRSGIVFLRLSNMAGDISPIRSLSSPATFFKKLLASAVDIFPKFLPCVSKVVLMLTSFLVRSSVGTPSAKSINDPCMFSKPFGSSCKFLVSAEFPSAICFCILISRAI